MQSLRNQIDTVQKARKFLALATAGLVAFFYFFGYRPEIAHQQALRGQTVSIQQQLIKMKTEAGGLTEVARKVEALRQRMDRFDKRLPRQEEMGQFMNEVGQISQAVNLKGLTYKRGDPRQTELFSELPIQFRFEGNYPSVFSFLRQTEDMQRLTRVRSLSLRSRDSQTGLVDVQLSMNIYYAEQ